MSSANAQSPRETELKLAVPPGSARRLLQEVFHDAPARRRHEVSTYFDTSELAFAQSGVTLRVRCADGKCVQTLKADGRAGVVADRAEWEWPIDSNRPDLELLRQTPVAHELPANIRVKPVFLTKIDRTVRTLTLGAGTTAEAAYDRGAIVARNRQADVSELELELRQGDPVELYRFALHLHRDIPFSIASESKAARGYRLLHGDAPAVQKAEPIELRSGISGAEALRQIVGAGLGQLLVNQPAGLTGEAEAVHQMRIAIRRLRAALMLFKPHLEAHAVDHFVSALRRMGLAFGAARDWDVFCTQILPHALASADSAGWRNLLEVPAGARRDAVHEEFARELGAPPFTGLALGLAAWAEQAHTEASVLGSDALQRPIEEISPMLLDRLAAKVERRGKHIDRSDADRHALRKSLKKLRYAVDYVQSLYQAEPVTGYLHACKKLQKVLGDINDTVAATELADSLADATHPDLTPAIGALSASLVRQRAEAGRKLAKRWKRFQAAPRFWRR